MNALALASSLSKYSRKSCWPRTPRTQSSPISPSGQTAPVSGLTTRVWYPAVGLAHRAGRVVLALDLAVYAVGDGLGHAVRGQHLEAEGRLQLRHDQAEDADPQRVGGLVRQHQRRENKGDQRDVGDLPADRDVPEAADGPLGHEHDRGADAEDAPGRPALRVHVEERKVDQVDVVAGEVDVVGTDLDAQSALAWVWTTALGREVVPEVYMIPAGSIGSIGRPG